MQIILIIWPYHDYYKHAKALLIASKESKYKKIKYFSYLTTRMHENIIVEKDGQCTRNVTMRRVRATIVAVENQYVIHILSVYL